MAVRDLAGPVGDRRTGPASRHAGDAGGLRGVAVAGAFDAIAAVLLGGVERGVRFLQQHIQLAWRDAGGDSGGQRGADGLSVDELAGVLERVPHALAMT